MMIKDIETAPDFCLEFSESSINHQTLFRIRRLAFQRLTCSFCEVEDQVQGKVLICDSYFQNFRSNFHLTPQYRISPSVRHIVCSPSLINFQYKPLFHPKVRKDPISQRQTASKTQCMLYFKDINFFHHKFWTQTFHKISFLLGLGYMSTWHFL